MKLLRSHSFITISSLALIALLAIQVTWIVKSAELKEQMFTEKANMILSKTVEAIGEDKVTCGRIGASLKQNSNNNISAVLSKRELHKIDSIFAFYMKYYHILVKYSYDVVKPTSSSSERKLDFSNTIYNQSLKDANQNELFELKLIFPDKVDFILAEMGSMFLVSVVLICIVLLMFWRTVLTFNKEKEISKRTNEFLNNMTHEFKTPLTNIGLSTKLLLRDTNIKQEDKIHHYADIILEENKKLHWQVEQILNMAAIERGEIPLQNNHVDVHILIEKSISVLTLQLENSRANINTNLVAENSFVTGDDKHLSNVINNLLDNAIKYSVDTPKITIKTWNEKGLLFIELLDNGIGIDKAHYKHIFETYYRVPTGNVHDVKGHGLGLSYVKKIVEWHGGHIEIQSELNKGSKFTISLKYA